MKVRLVIEAIIANDIVDVLNENDERMFSLNLRFVAPAVTNEWKCAFNGNIPRIWQEVEIPSETIKVWEVISKI